MAKQLWVDGYNLIGHLKLLTSGSLENARSRVLGLLSGRKVRVYFDARSGGSAERRGHVEIVFTQGGTADDRIVQDLRALGTAARDIEVVTNDRELGGRCRQLGAACTACAAFLNSLQPQRTGNTARKSPPGDKSARMSRRELEDLQRIFETPPTPENPSAKPPGPGRRPEQG